MGRASQHQLITGLRGVGKTVLLGTLASVAQHEGYRVVRLEAGGGDDTLRSLLRQMRRILEDLDGGTKVGRALRSIESVSLTLAGSGVSVERGAATPDREALADVVVDVAIAAADHDIGVMVALDEAQMLGRDDLRRLLAGVHRCGQDALPLACVLAGLPDLVGEVAKAATYAERMFTVADLGALTPDQGLRRVPVLRADLGVPHLECRRRRADIGRRRRPGRTARRPCARLVVLRGAYRPHPCLGGRVRAGTGVPRTGPAPQWRSGEGNGPDHQPGRCTARPAPRRGRRLLAALRLDRVRHPPLRPLLR